MQSHYMYPTVPTRVHPSVNRAWKSPHLLFFFVHAAVARVVLALCRRSPLEWRRTQASRPTSCRGTKLRSNTNQELGCATLACTLWRLHKFSVLYGDSIYGRVCRSQKQARKHTDSSVGWSASNRIFCPVFQLRQFDDTISTFVGRLLRCGWLVACRRNSGGKPPNTSSAPEPSARCLAAIGSHCGVLLTSPVL